MKIVLGADTEGFELKKKLKNYLNNQGYETVDITPENEDTSINAALKVADELVDKSNDKGILIDGYGVESFMAANKRNGIICANIFDEHSAYMTRSHNNTNMITIGTHIVGDVLAEKIAGTFVAADYAGGRHQIRVDMLNKMC